jgi:hypothetical protein
MKYLLLLILKNSVIQRRHSVTNGITQASGDTSNVGKLGTAYRKADEGELGNRNM